MKKETFVIIIKKFFAKKYLRGFSLIEAMVGIFIISVVIGGPMTIAGRAAQGIRSSKEIFTSTFLGEEAIELIRFKRDTLFLECSDVLSVNCGIITYAGVAEIAPGDPAWRIFKAQFGYPNSLCFSANGCTFDDQSILLSPIATSTEVYDASSTSCGTLYQDRTSQLKDIPNASSLGFMYLCGTHKVASSTDAQITRVIKMTSTSTAACPSFDCSYSDDIKVDVNMTYRFNGSNKTITVTDFIKPRS